MLHSVTVIGAGPAGLSVAACLKRFGISPIILEGQAHVGSAWRNYPDRLQLHSAKSASALPGLPFPSECPRFPTRQQVTDYLEAYARHFELKPAFEEPVTQIVQDDAFRWRIRTRQRELFSQHVVLATGHTRVPNIPSWPGMNEFRGQILHSNRFKNGSPWKHQRVLVVGFGNSAGDIAVDLHEHQAEVTMAVRGEVNVIPREVFGMPVLAAGSALRRLPAWVSDRLAAALVALSIGDITRLGLRKKPYGPREQMKREGRVPLVDVGTLALIREGKVKIMPGIQRFTHREVVFENGVVQPFDAVILATGYRAGIEEFYPSAHELLDAQGTPLPGRELPAGLHLCGFNFGAGGRFVAIAKDAQEVAQKIASTRTAE